MLERFAFAAVAKCYPGRLPGGRGDRAPDRGERERCRPVDGRRSCASAIPPSSCPSGASRSTTGSGARRSAEVVGRRFERDGRVIVPLPHPSGASAWTNDAGQPGARRPRRCHSCATRSSDEPPRSASRAPGLASGAVERGQASAETAALWGLIALILAIVARAARPRAWRATSLRSLGGALPHAGRTSRLTPDERALRNPLLRALIDRALPRLVLERDGSGDDDEVPVWTSCRHAACARAGRAEPVLHVHVVHAAARARRRALDVLPRLADQPPAAGRAARLPP